MDQMQPQPIQHLLQVYPSSVSESKLQNPQIIHISHPSLPPSQGKVTYQQTITSDMHIPSSLHSDMISQNHIVMSCQQTQLQTLHHPLQGQVLQSTDLNQLQITSHMIVPSVPLFKQQMLVSEVQQFYGQYEYGKEQCIISKPDPEGQMLNENVECKPENSPPQENLQSTETKKKRSRNLTPTPSSWVCNIRKLKHQRGEAYISRRGKYVPERKIRNMKDCRNSCKLKCNERIEDADRELLFKAFYSLNAAEKRHFLLNTTERHDIKTSKGASKSIRKYSYKYFFILRASRYMVCKNFYLGTLAISQKPIYNVHMGKSETNLPKPDGRGLSETSNHALPNEAKDRVRRHILSFPTADSKPIKQFSKKKQYLQPPLNVRKMYVMYSEECIRDDIVPVKESMYRKIVRGEFNLHFPKLKKDDQLCCKCKGSIKKK